MDFLFLVTTATESIMASAFSSSSATTATPYLLLLIFSPLFLLLPAPPCAASYIRPVISGGGQGHYTYIVHVERLGNTSLLQDEGRLRSYHLSFLPNMTLDSGEPRLVYSYREAISGFAAWLTPDEARAVSSAGGFLHAYVDRRRRLLTTHTPEFLGLSTGGGLWYASTFQFSLARTSAEYGKGSIIGILDTGIDIGHPSFSSDGMPSPPPYWRGGCESLICNNKIIGFKTFNRSARSQPSINHGTHAASIAGGGFVSGASVIGNAGGVAAGMAPKAHLSVYQVCSSSSCADSDVLAGIDQAIYDQVDVISASFGSSASHPFYEDSVAIGAYSALRRRILTVAAAGNAGPAERTVVNDAPWVLTVGASTTDRRIRVIVRLGNGTKLLGESGYQPTSFNSTELELGNGGGCGKDSFDGADLGGKIVLCEVGFEEGNVEKGRNVRDAGGAAMILMNREDNGETTLSEAHVLPAAHLGYSSGRSAISYYLAGDSPTAGLVFAGTTFGEPSSPAVAAFSSRGPSGNNGGILKPDLVAPGVNIVGAGDKSGFEFQSGTSAGAAHVAGVAALIRSAHPRWSPSAIKSAMMTTAGTEDKDGKAMGDQIGSRVVAGRFAMGAGEVDPSKASDPGLVYVLHSHWYKRYLCGLGYSDRQVTTITQRRSKCWRYRRDGSPEQLNYPSISVVLGSPETKRVRRWVRNVGEDDAVYIARIERPEGVNVEVVPPRIYFARRHYARSFEVVITAEGGRRGVVTVGQLSWVSSSGRAVNTPISVTLT